MDTRQAGCTGWDGSVRCWTCELDTCFLMLNRAHAVREARLHETMYDVAGERHSFAAYDEGKEPKKVLDVSAWPQ